MDSERFYLSTGKGYRIMKKKHSLFALLAVFCMLFVGYPQIAKAEVNLSQEPNYIVNYEGTSDAAGYLFPQSSEFEFQGFSNQYEAWVYQYGINEIYAKHGYCFQTPEVVELFSAKTWYTPNAGFDLSMLSETEKYNIDFLSQCLAATGQDGGYGIPSGNHIEIVERELTEEEKQVKEQLKNVQLNHSYTTRFPDVNMITYPRFTFEYPDGWTVTQEEVTPYGENVTLTSENGAQVQYSHIAQNIQGGFSAVSMARVEVTPIAESSFVPGYVQATDLSYLGKFMVAKLKQTGILDMQNDAEFTDIDGSECYAVLPESKTGGRDDVRGPYVAEFAFDYSSNIAFIASPGANEQFTDEEKIEAIAILASFREG